MAGSQSEQSSPFSDPILTSRLEAIKQVAGGVSERVAVMDRDFNLIYANKRTWVEQQSERPIRQHAKCYEAFLQRTDPCEACPAIKVFDAPHVQSVSCSIGGDATACGMNQAFPLMGKDGQVGSMLVLFKPPAQSSRLPRTLVPEETSLPTVREHLGDLIGRSAAMHELFDMVSLVADSSATVLIQGESGTGKE